MGEGYQGQVIRIPLGKEGLCYSKNPSSLPPSALLQAESITFSDDSAHLMPGRSKIGKYAGTTFTFAPADVDTGANETIAETAHGLVTGDGPVYFSTTGGLPNPLVADTDYWIIRFDANKISLATSRALAFAGTKVNLTSQGTGTHTLASRSIFSVYDWWPQEGTQYTVTLSSDGRVYITASATDTQLAQNETIPVGTTTPRRAVFVECGGSAAINVDSVKLLAIFTGQGAPGFFQGTSLLPGKAVYTPTDWTASYPVNGVVHNGRLFSFGNPNKPHTLYGSTIDNHQNFRLGVETGNASASSATYTHIHPGVGLRLYQGFSHKGLLFLLKFPRGVFYLDDTDLNPTGWKAAQVTDAMGCAPTPFSGILVDDGILFMSAAGQFFLITATTQGGVTVTDLSTRLYLDQWLQTHVNLTRLDQVVAAWDSTLKIAYFAVPSQINGTNSLTNDLLLMFDFRAFTKGEAKVRVSYTYRDASQALAVRRNPSTYRYEVMQADYAGNLWRLANGVGNDERSVDSALPGNTPSLSGYVGRFQISHTDLEEYMSQYDPTLGPMNKNFDWLGVEYVPNTGGNITVVEYVDGVAQPSQTVSLTQSGPRLASAPGFTEFTIWAGSGSTVASELAGTTTAGLDLRVKWVRLTGTGRRTSIEIASSGTAGEDMHVTALYLGFRKAGQDVGRGQGSS